MTRLPRMLAVVSRFKWMHINYLAALREHFDLRVAWSGEVHKGAVAKGIEEGVIDGAPVGRVAEDGVDRVRARLSEAIASWDPEVVHIMYYRHEELTLVLRELVGNRIPLVWECRDPLTTLDEPPPGSPKWVLERDAILASDAHVFVNQATRTYFEEVHGVDLRRRSLIVPQGFARHTIAPPSPKLSATDGRVHIALIGTADDLPDHGRWYVDIIRSLIAQGLVVHSHFHDLERVDLEPYRALAEELPDYHHHPTIPHRYGTALSEMLSRYDMMGLFHELDATHHNEAATLAVCLPTKAVCGWLHAAMPVVCRPHYRGVTEWIDALGIGFVIDDWDDLARVAADRRAIARATERCLEGRDRFTNEHNAERIRDFIEPLLRWSGAPAPSGTTPRNGRPAGRG